MHSDLDLSELNTRIGRLFMAGMPGAQLDAGTEMLIQDRGLGGVILFARNIEDPIQVAGLCNELQKTAMKALGIPLFIAVDQEGGRVARLKEPFTAFPGNAAIGDSPNSVERAVEFGRITAREMTLVGLNMDMAPVVDVLRGDPERHLAGRTFGNNPDEVTLLGRRVVKALQENRVMATAKHFPGLGRATLDPHHHLPTIDADQSEIEGINLPPFRGAIEEGVSAIMSSHAIYPSLDPDNPATLSEKIMTTLLRERLGFEGLIITDDLEMGAIKKGWGVAKGAVAAFDAGCDILLICEDQGSVLESMDALRGKILKKETPLKRLHQSVERIRKAKAEFLNRTHQVSLDEVRSYFTS